MNNEWWKEAVIYQIYPKSFCDSNNDGIGDLEGIISKLDYIKNLGIDTIWLSPIYESPMEDNGYDISNYYEISSLYGDMNVFDRLIKEAKKRNIKILLDLVANHTSTKHKWFLEAIKDKNSKYHDYYFFSKTKDEKKSSFGGEAWEYVPSLDEYYYHYFGVGQADLNWQNENVRKEIVNIMLFWLNKGVSGFRLDAIELIGKDLKNNVIANGEILHSYLREVMEEVRKSYPDFFTVGEGWPNVEIMLKYTANERKEINELFQFEVPTYTWKEGPLGKFSCVRRSNLELKEALNKWQQGIHNKSYLPLFWENHDLTRSVNRFGSLIYPESSAKALAAILFLEEGTPFIYQGEELGLVNTVFENLDEIKDIEAKMLYKEYVEEKKLYTDLEFLKMLNVGCRDQGRLPMPWNSSLNLGFNEGSKTWIKVPNEYEKMVASSQILDDNSVYSFYKKLISLRKGKFKEILINGSFKLLDFSSTNIIAYQRLLNDKKIDVIVNFSDEETKIELKNLNIILGSHNKKINKEYTLSPYEVIVLSSEV